MTSQHNTSQHSITSHYTSRHIMYYEMDTTHSGGYIYFSIYLFKTRNNTNTAHYITEKTRTHIQPGRSLLSALPAYCETFEHHPLPRPHLGQAQQRLQTLDPFGGRRAPHPVDTSTSLAVSPPAPPPSAPSVLSGRDAIPRSRDKVSSQGRCSWRHQHRPDGEQIRPSSVAGGWRRLRRRRRQRRYGGGWWCISVLVRRWWSRLKLSFCNGGV